MTYTDHEYQQYLHLDSWKREETDHLFDLCRRFDLRFIVIHDRWDAARFPGRSVEDLKERYYDIVNLLNRVYLLQLNLYDQTVLISLWNRQDILELARSQSRLPTMRIMRREERSN